MKAVILAGGLGTRISEETIYRPKPMIEIGGKPILWHILKIFETHGIKEFIICCGYKGHMIKEYFSNYVLHHADITFDMQSGSMKIHNSQSEQWKITLVDTGEETMTGGRLKRVAHYLGSEPFLMTYGDGVADVDITKLVAFHKAQGKSATLTAIQPPGRFGALDFDGVNVKAFAEKPKGDGGWVNGGFFVLNTEVLNLISGDESIWEREPLEKLAKSGQLTAYKHHGFWYAVDSLRDKNTLEDLWRSGSPPWRIWEKSPKRIWLAS